MPERYYKVSGRFEAYNETGILITDQFFLNKIFEAFLPAIAKNMGMAFAKRRVAKKYGRGARIEQIGNLAVRESRQPIKRRKIKSKQKQKRLF